MTDSGDPRAAARAQAGGADQLAGTAPAASGDPGVPAKAPRAASTNLLVRFWRIAALPVLSIFFALIVAGVLMILSRPIAGEPIDLFLPLAAYRALLEGAFGRPELWAEGNFNGLTNTAVNTAPLLLGGLAVGLAFKAGLFNIGVAGQFLVGAFAAAAVGAMIGHMDTVVAVPIALGVACLGGAFYGFIPGFLKARTGAHEVVTTIMLNNIAGFVLAWAVSDLFQQPGASFARTGDINNAALPVIFGRNLHAGVLLAVAAIFIVKFVLDRTTLGFEIRTVGANPNAARYAGISPVFIIALTMSLSGLLAGLAGGIQILGLIGFYSSGITANVGFDSLTVALLGRSSPYGIFGSALLFGVFRAGQGRMQTQTDVPQEMIDVIQALIILFLAADIIVRRVFRLRTAKGALEGEVRSVTASWGEQVAR
jgi:general nucleoside transport system permease protein